MGNWPKPSSPRPTLIYFRSSFQILQYEENGSHSVRDAKLLLVIVDKTVTECVWGSWLLWNEGLLLLSQWWSREEVGHGTQRNL